MYRNYRLSISILVLAGMLYGCETAYSRASISDGSVNIEKNTFDFGDIRLQFLSWNRRGIAFYLLPLVPFNVSDDAKGPFRMTVWLTPSRDGFTLDPKMFYLLMGNKTFAPNSIAGISFIGKNPNRVIRQIRAPQMVPVTLETNVTAAIDLLFDVTPREPEESFVIEIDGLELKGSPYSVPRIEFNKGAKVAPVPSS